MKFFIALFLLLSLPQIVSAHGSNGASSITINQTPAKENLAQKARENLFSLPPDTDLAPQNYIVNEEVSFEVDVHDLFEEHDSISNTPFVWNFGDGTVVNKKGETSATYSYKKPGTYNLLVHALNGDTKILVASLLITILPNADYVSPQATITIDGESTAETISIPLGTSHIFSASSKRNPTAKIVSYKWDFDDGTLTEGERATHKYQLPQYSAAVALRITDENGIFSDTVVTITNSGNNEPGITDKLGISSGNIIVVGIVILAGIGIFSAIFMRKRRK